MDASILPSYVTVTHPSKKGYFRMPAGSDKNIESAMKYEACRNDIFVCSYPKCGCTWLQNIVWRLLNDGDGVPGNIRQHIPFLEFDGKEAIVNVQPRKGIKIIKTHLPCSWVPKHAEAKYIFMVREPKDVIVSLYHHIKGFVGTGPSESPSRTSSRYVPAGYDWSEGRFETLVDAFLVGRCDCIDYFDMIDEWLQEGMGESLHIILYEEMINHPEGEILRLAEFLNVDLSAKKQTIVSDIIKNTSLAKMKEEDEKWYTTARTTPFIRKGIVGDWKKHMTPEQAVRVDKRTRQLLDKYPTILKTWNSLIN